MSARIRAALVRGRRLACDLLAAVPREVAAQQAAAAAAALGDAENECDGLRLKLADKAQVLETYARLRDEAQRVEIHRDKLAADLCGAEEARDEAEGERDRALAQAESAALEIVALRQQLEDLRGRLQVAEADWRRLAVAARAMCGVLEGWSLSTAGNVALGNVRRALGMVP